MPPKKRKEQESPASIHSKPPRKRAKRRALPKSIRTNANELDPQVEATSNALLRLHFEGVKVELRDVQEKYETACREHQAAIEEKQREIDERDERIAALEQRLHHAEMALADQFYGHQAPHFYYSEERNDRPEVTRVCSRRGRR